MVCSLSELARVRNTKMVVMVMLWDAWAGVAAPRRVLKAEIANGLIPAGDETKTREKQRVKSGLGARFCFLINRYNNVFKPPAGGSA